jgi:2-furoate---CoA ligase
MNLGEAFARSVARNPDRLAIVDGPRRLTWAEWDLEVRKLAGGLTAAGLRPGDHLVTLLSNRHETATLYWACQMLGLIFTPFNWRATAEEVAFVIEDSDAKALFFEDRSAAAVGEQNGTTPPLLVTLDALENWEKLKDSPPAREPYRFASEMTGLMLYTSGTTGKPKGVPRSHAAEWAAAVSCIGHLGYRDGMSQLGVMPLFHTMGQRALLMSTALGGPLIFMPTFDAGAALALIEAERIGALFLVPTLFHDLVTHPSLGECDLSSVDNIAYAGMSMTSDLTRRCVEVFAPDRFTNFYGSSEIFTFTVCDHVADKPGCAGRAGFGQEIRVVTASTEPTVTANDAAPLGAAGEIIASMGSPEAFAGYWKRPDADAKAIRDGWYFTGDLGRIDEDGELTVVGRVDDMIISGGENIHPEEVEDVLTKSRLVRQAAVIGAAHPRWGEEVVAFIEPAGPAPDPKDLDEHCLASGLARFKRPRRYEFVDTLPRSAAGKLLRRQLRS